MVQLANRLFSIEASLEKDRLFAGQSCENEHKILSCFKLLVYGAMKEVYDCF